MNYLIFILLQVFERKTERVSTCPFIPNKPENVRVRLGQSQELRTLCGCPGGWQGPRLLKHHPLSLRVHQQEAGLEAKLLGLKLALQYEMQMSPMMA